MTRKLDLEKIKSMMAERGITNSELAFRFKIKEITIYKKLKGDRKFSVDEIIALAQVLVVDINKLFSK